MFMFLIRDKASYQKWVSNNEQWQEAMLLQVNNDREFKFPSVIIKN